MVNQWKLELKRIIPKVLVARSTGQSNGDSRHEIEQVLKHCSLIMHAQNCAILGDPGADSGDEGKSKRAEK